MRIFVTGHQGNIGTVLVPMLLAEGHHVVGLDSNLFTGCSFHPPVMEIPYIRKDIRDVDRADVRGFDAVVHLAALSNEPLGALDPALTYAINHTAAVRLASLSKEAGVQRFVFASSCSAYGATDTDLVDEKTPLRPFTPYGRSKALVEQDLARVADSCFSPIVLRNATAYGVSPRLRFDLVLNHLVAWAATAGVVRPKSDGTAWHPLVHVEDIARAFLAVLEAPLEVVHNQIFNVGVTGESYRIHELAEVVQETVPGARIEMAEGDGAGARGYRVDASKIARLLPAFVPRWDIRRGARQLCDAYRRYGLRLEEIEGPRFNRLDHLRQQMVSGSLGGDLRWRQARAVHASGWQR